MLSGQYQKVQKMFFKTNYSLSRSKVLQNAPLGPKYCRMLKEHSAILSTFIKLPFFIKIFVLSIFEWPFLHRIYIIESQWEHSAILSTFIKLPFVIKIFVLSFFEWPFYTGFTVLNSSI